MIVLETSALIELLTDGRSLREVVTARLLAEEAAGEDCMSRLSSTLRRLKFCDDCPAKN